MRRLRTCVNLLLFALPLCYLLAGSYLHLRRIGNYLFTGKSLARLLSSVATARAGQVVAVSDVRIIGDLWNREAENQISLVGVRISERANPSETLAKADSVTLTYRCNQLFDAPTSLQPLINSLLVVNPKVRLIRDGTGRWNVAPMLRELFGGEGESQRAAFGRIAIEGGSLLLKDAALPRPRGAAPAPFETQLNSISGVGLLRSDKSVAFEASSGSWEGIAAGARIAGVFAPKPSVAVQGDIEVKGVNATNVGRRALPAAYGVITHGSADISVSLAYAAPKPNGKFDMSRLIASGRAVLNGVSLHGGELQAPVENASGTLYLTPSALHGELSGLYAGTPVRANGSIENLAPMRPTRESVRYEVQGVLPALEARTITQYPVLARFLKKSSPEAWREAERLQGRGDLTVVSAGTFRKASVTAHWQAPTLSNGALALRDVQAWLSYGDGALHSEIAAKMQQGSLSLTTHSANGANRLSLHGQDVPIEGLRSYWGAKAPQASGIVRFVADAEKSSLTPWTSAFDVHAQRLRVNGKNIHSARVNGGAREDKVFIENLYVDDARGFLTANGEIDRKTRQLDIHFAADDLDIGSIVSDRSALKPKSGVQNTPDDEKEALELPVEGTAFIRGETNMGALLSGTWDNPTLSGRLTAFNVRLGKLESERVEGVVDASRDRIVVRQGNILLSPGFVSFSAFADGLRNAESVPPTIAATAQAEKLDLSRLLSLGGFSNARALSGSISTGEISLTGTTKDIQTRAPFRVVFNNTTIGNMPIANAEAELSFRDKSAIIERATASVAQGTVVAQGAIKSDGAINLTAGVDGVDVASLFAPYQPSDELTTLQGKMFARISVGGVMEAPSANVRLQIANLLYQTYPFGSLVASASYQNRHVAISDATLGELGEAGGRVYLSGISYNLDGGALSGDGAWSGVRLSSIRDLLNRAAGGAKSDGSSSPLLTASAALNPLEGDLSGRARISGTAQEPVFNVEWDAAPLTVDGYPITLNKGGGLFSEKYASLPQITLTAQDGAAEITAKKIEYQGEIEATLATYNLNLGVLSRWANLVVAPSAEKPETTEFDKWLALPGKSDIKGSGNISLSFGGKTNAPSIVQGSVNLSKIDIGKLLLDGSRSSFIAIDKADLNDVSLQSGVLKSDSIAIRYQDTVMRGTALMDGFQKESVAPAFSRIHVAAQLVPRSDDERNLQSLARFLPNLLHKDSEGRLELSMEIEGTRKEPLQEVRGKARLTSKRLQLARIATGLEDVDAQFEMADGDLIVNSFRGKTKIYRESEFAKKSVGAEVSLSGRLPLGLYEGISPVGDGGLRLRADKMFFEEAPFPGATTGAARGQAQIDARLQGSLKTPTLTGKVVFSQTQFALPGEFAAPASGADRLPAYPQFDLSFIAGNEVRLFNQMMDTKVTGTLTAQGSPASPKLDGRLDLLAGGRLRLVTTRMNLLNPSFITLRYPDTANGEGVFALNVNLRAEANLVRNNNFGGGSERERTLIRMEGPLTGVVVDPVTGESKLRVFSTDPRVNSQTFLQSLLVGDPSQLERLGTLPGNVLTQQLANVFTGAVLPDVFDKPAEQLGLRDLSVTFDPIRNVTLNLSRNLFGPVYLSYSRSLSSARELFTFRASLRIKDRYQTTYEIREGNEQRILAEGIWRW